MNPNARRRWAGIGAIPALVVAVSMLGTGCSKQSKIAGHIHRGSEYAAGGDYLKAEIEFLNAFRLDPGNAAVVRQLGEVYFQQGNIPKSFVFLKKAADDGATDEDLRIKLGRIYLTGRKLKEARDEAVRVLQGKPDSDEAWIVLSQASVSTNEMRDTALELERLRPRADKAAGFHLAVGMLAFRKGDLQGAEDSFKRALAIAPKMSMAHELMAGLQFRRSDLAGGGQSLKTAAELAPVRSVTPLRYVDFLKDTGDEAGAMKKMEEIVKQAPDYIPASVQLAQMLFAAKRNDESAEVIKRLLGMDRSNYEAMLLSGRLMLVKGEPEKGLAELEKLARAHPRVPQAHYHLAIAQLLNNDANKALASLGQAVSNDPEYADALLLQAELNLRKGDPVPVVSSMSDLVRRRPQLGRAYVLLGDAHAARGNVAEAMDAYSRLSRLLPKDPQPYVLMGGVLARSGNRADARKAFQKGLELSPDFLPAFEQLVELDLADGRYPEVLSRVQGQMQKNPKSASLLVLMARAHLGQTNDAQAEVSLRKAIELEPGAVAAPVVLAQILGRSGRSPEALTVLRQALAGNPKNEGIMFHIGMIENELGNVAAARKSYEELLKINPKNGPALNNLAVLYSEHFKMLDQAFELARKGRELFPSDPVLGDTLGWILFKRREYGWALGVLQQSSQKLPNEPEISYHLGMVQYMMGDEEGARAALTRAASGRKAYAGREDAAQRLQLLKLDFASADAATLARMEKHLADNPGDPVVAGRLAAIEEKKGNFDKALAIYERAIAENKGNVAAMARAARIYSERLNNPKKALELAKAAREASPEDPAMAHMLGAIAYASGDAAWAVRLLQESSRKIADDPEILFDLALAQYANGKVTEGEESMRQAIAMGKAFPRLEAARRWLTVSSLFKDPARLRQSEAAIGEWLKTEPSNPALMMAAGSVHELQNNPAAAEQAYTRLLAVHPTFAPASLRLGWLQAARPATLTQAFDVATRLRQSLPNDPEVAGLLGVVSYKRGDHSRAVQLLAESARQRASDPQIWHSLGLAHHQLKQKDDARRALERLLTLEQTGERAAEARKILAEIK